MSQDAAPCTVLRVERESSFLGGEVTYIVVCSDGGEFAGDTLAHAVFAHQQAHAPTL